ncbi:penicillin-binding protein 2 [Aquisalimonas lutea]|uniref:peptidoglycan D,D-transpeptidase FtsI family protein n=1 Tax=Aquisalimonas lutea TaxID=1327750 RepID=UPI0025B42F9F|nr:penicillin-binding protein 2 [Aquisalimonas lutea]MDN3517408.1 penicillin-binding protein 2 [Aquisalimonas lutea]
MNQRNARAKEQPPYWRYVAVLVAFALLTGALAWRAVDLQVVRNDFLQHQGDARHLRVVSDPAHRGMITDRNGEPLAISTPVHSVWAHPGNLLEAHERLPELARVLDLDAPALADRLRQRRDREFVYLRRHVRPERADAVMALGLPGVALQREYQRFYPAGEVTAHLIGFTDVDDIGLAGIELAYDSWLQGESGRKRVVQDRHGRIIDDVEQLQEPRPGRDLTLSIDRRLQYLAYRELKAAVNAHGARGGALVLMDPDTGEILALANQPAFNPNDRSSLHAANRRNAALVDAWEPGSTIKPFTVAAALEAGMVTPDTMIDTGPGVLRVGGHRVRDAHDYGRIDVSTVISKSSNVGAAKLALAMDEERLWRFLGRAGFGQRTGVGFPGEAGGRLADMPPDNELERATLAFGYGLSVTPLQLTRAYAAIAGDGTMPAPSLIRTDAPAERERIMSEATADDVLAMLEQAASPGGTAVRAQVPAYRIAGKTGTVHKSVNGGYAEDRYVAWFAGMAPASDPELVMTVMLDEPSGDAYYGGQVAAPVFSEVMGGALRLLNVPPDGLQRPSGPEPLTAMGEGQP